jgi:hypothetical protein
LPERPLFDPLTSLLFYGGLLLAFSQIRQPRYLFILIWFAVTLIPSAITPQAPSTIRIIGALPLVYLLPSLAIKRLINWLSFPRRRESRSLALDARLHRHDTVNIKILSLTLLLYALLLIPQTIYAGFNKWRTHPETAVKYQTISLDMSRYWKSQPQTNAPAIADPFYEPIDADSFWRNLGYNPQARWVELTPHAGALIWPHGEATTLLVPEDSPLPESLRQQVGIPSEPLYRSHGHVSFAVYPLPELEMPDPVVDIVFEDKIRLIGVEALPVDEERPFTLFTYWEVLAPLPWDLTAFVHVLGDEPAPVRQHDAFDLAPERLQPGDIVVQRHLFALPDDRKRPYVLIIGLYTNQDGIRWQPLNEKNAFWLYKDGYFFDGNEHDE